MELNNQDVVNSCNNFGKIISEGLKNPIVRQLCTHPRNKSYSEIKKIQIEFSRFIGFCILFKSIKNVDDYMLLASRENQINFLEEQIANQIGIPKPEIAKRKREIAQFAVNNFKKDGYVFHAANSLSAEKKMTDGLIDNDVDIEQQKELLKIEAIYRKYNPNSDYSPIGHGATDITDGKVGWFFDGLPIHSTGYANSPQWFNYLCGKSYVYFENIPEDQRNGYANREYKKALNAVLWLVENEDMSLEDRKEVLTFFKKCWNKYKDTTPCLIFVPVREVGINEDVSVEQYLDDDGYEKLFNDIISGTVNPIKNCCCKKKISPDKLSFVDLSPILPLSEKDNINISQNDNLAKTDDDYER